MSPEAPEVQLADGLWAWIRSFFTWRVTAGRVIQGRTYRVVWNRLLRLYRVQELTGRGQWRVVSFNRVALFRAIRFGRPVGTCPTCRGTGFVDEGAGDCGSPNYCARCDGSGLAELPDAVAR